MVAGKTGTENYYCWLPVYVPASYIRGCKSQNSTGTRCRGILVLESRCRGFLVLESRCRGFLVLESRCRGFLVLESRCRGFLVLESRCRVFLVLESRCRGFLVLESRRRGNVPPRPRFRYHCENKKIKHNYVNYVVEKHFTCPNLCNIFLQKLCISELENK